MNPNAPSFGFNPAASGFKPRNAQPTNDAEYFNQGFSGMGIGAQNAAPASAPAHESAPAPAPAPSTTAAPLPPMAAAALAATNDKPAGAKQAVSISLGGAKKETVPAKPAAVAEPPAQAEAAKGQAVKQQNKAEKKVAEKSAVDASKVLDDARKVTDEETLKDLFGDADIKSHLNVVFIGHVDAGKSTLGGNLLYMTGMVDKRTLEKYEREAKELGRESWYLSWALDSTSQEREKGKTVEVGRAFFETEKRRYTILDAPGHKTYVPNMIAGAAQADIAILVISARRGEFETGFERGGQTREHAMLVKTAGVQRLIVVINKMDDQTVNWDKERYDEIVGKLSPFLKMSGFNPKTDVTFIPVSAYSGANLKESVPKDVCAWFDGPALLPFLDSLEQGDRNLNASLKLPISEKYADMGTYVVGKIESGTIKKGENLVLMPNATNVEVLGLYSEVDEEVPAAISGDNVRIKLKGVDLDEVQAGFVLTDPKDPVHVVTRFEAQLAILEHRNIICAGYSAVMHAHSLSEEVNLAELLHYYDKKTGKKSRKGPQFAKKGMKIIAQIQATAPIALERFKDCPQLGRFTLRDEGKTIAIGKR
ncbi:Sup35p [Malassezia vespertilionis]|uniref:Eukaryotic peptide chain release factor GTP-binding subunit n=1 Tax=Malassezia vespertilionis TaxID=2020962 RepID=A0A2N1JB02_9BASI|nr:Sup35p [Malassezia vespertilionis]